MRKSLGRRVIHKQTHSKLIIRHLPPNLTEDVFKETLDLPSGANTQWYLTGPVSADLGYFATSRAYVTFSRFDEMMLFKDKYDGYVFIDSKRGGEYRAQVDFAPFQKSKKSSRKDPKAATLEKDADYLKFVESLNAPKNESNINAAEFNLKELESRDRELKLTNGCPKVKTPLIEYVLMKKSDRYSKKTDESRSQEDKNRRNTNHGNRRHQSKSERMKGQKKQSNVQSDETKKPSRESTGNKTKSSGGPSKTRDSKGRTKSVRKSNERVNDGNVVVLTKKSTPAPSAASSATPSAISPDKSTKKGENETREPKKRRIRGSRGAKKANPKVKDDPANAVDKKVSHSP